MLLLARQEAYMKTKWLPLIILCCAAIACNLGTNPYTSTPNPPYTPFVPTAQSDSANQATAIIASATAAAGGLSPGLGIPDVNSTLPPTRTGGLSDPINSATTGTPIPTSGAAVNPQMHNGVSAIVNCVGRDPIALRSSPTRGSTIKASLQPLTVVQVIGGPVSSEGFTWWQIKTPAGLDGWSVEFADNLPVLTPEQCGSR